MNGFFFRIYPLVGLKNIFFLVLISVVVFVLATIIFVGVDPINKILLPYEYRDFTLLQRLLTETRVVVFYLSLLLFPHPLRLNFDHDFLISYSFVEPVSTIVRQLSCPVDDN